MTKAEEYAKVQLAASASKNPEFSRIQGGFRADVGQDGWLRIHARNSSFGDTILSAVSISSFIDWLKETFIDEIKTDDNGFGEADTKKVVKYDI